MKDIRVRQAMAMAINSRQYSQVVDKGVNTPTNQPFVPDTPYYVADAGYPAYNPSKAKALVKQLETETGKPVAFTLQSTNSAYSIQVVAVPPEPARSGGDEGHADPDPAGRPDQQRPGGDCSRPRRGGSSRRWTRTSTTCGGARPRSSGPATGRSPRTSPATPTPRSRPCSSRAAPPPTRPTRAAGVPGRRQAPERGPALHLAGPGHVGRRRPLRTSRTGTTPRRLRVPRRTA